MKQYSYTGKFSDEERIENNFEDSSYAFELDVNVLRDSGRNNTVYISKSNRSVGWRFKGTELDITPYIQHLIDKGLVVEKFATDEHWLIHSLNHLGSAQTKIGQLSTFQQFSVIRNGIQELIAENARLKTDYAALDERHSGMLSEASTVFEENKAFKKAQENKQQHQYQYHGRANSMPKRLREYFEAQGTTFTKTEMVDVVEWVEIELVNRWESEVHTSRFSEEQITFLTNLGFNRVDDDQYKKQYGPDHGSFIWVYSSLDKKWFNQDSQVMSDRNLFVSGHEECWQDLETIRNSKLFIMGGK